MGRQRLRPMLGALAVVLAAAFLMAGSASAAAATGAYAPLDRPGPTLSVPAATLQSALACTPGVTHATRDPILLVPGTNLEPQSNYSWNYERAFSALGWP